MTMARRALTFTLCRCPIHRKTIRRLHASVNALCGDRLSPGGNFIGPDPKAPSRFLPSSIACITLTDTGSNLRHGHDRKMHLLRWTMGELRPKHFLLLCECREIKVEGPSVQIQWCIFSRMPTRMRGKYPVAKSRADKWYGALST
jgi:hypothetical protein